MESKMKKAKKEKKAARKGFVDVSTPKGLAKGFRNMAKDLVCHGDPKDPVVSRAQRELKAGYRFAAEVIEKFGDKVKYPKVLADSKKFG